MPQPPPIPKNRHIPNLTSVLPALPRRSVAASVSSSKGSVERSAAPLSRESLRNTSCFLISLVVHCVALIILALVVPTAVGGNAGMALIVELPGEADVPVVPESLSISSEDPQLDTAPLVSAATEVQVAEVPHVRSPFAAPEPVAVVSLPTEQTMQIPASSLLVNSSLPIGGGIEGRNQSQRSRLAGERGGTPESEDAVELALVWLAEHQREDGSWCLKLKEGPCKGKCSHSGLIESNTAATALALLPFLGAGYSHQEGQYKDVVKKGLYYLTTRMVITGNGGDLTENVTLYAQGLSALALCEGLAMSGDEQLRAPAQSAIDFICYAQHSAGGWRYAPGQPGDTTVTGWQVMALKSARLAKLSVPSPTTQSAQDFLDSVQESGGAFYGYQRPGKLPGPTSVGLLLRMYSGWPRDDERLGRGVTYLSHLGPSETDMYFDYYATLVLHHYGGQPWDKWNSRMRDHLVKTQSKSGHERGSWFFPDKHGSVGGRLYTTAMCAMILEVYYRYLPLYGDGAVADGF